MKRIKFNYWFIGLIVVLSACSDEAVTDEEEASASPKAPVTAEPNLVIAPDGMPILSWIEEHGESSRLMWSKWDGEDWSDQKQIAEGNDWFVNWADFPSIACGKDGQMATNYLAKSGEGTYAYDVKLQFSEDAGLSWGESMIPHNDKTETEHGFVSILSHGDNFMCMWLDGRNYADSVEQMTLRAAEITSQGKIVEEFLIDDCVCDCCPTTAVQTSRGPMVAYRDRSEQEIRDIYFSRFEAGTWTAPIAVADDAWNIAGCPVNGPAIDANDSTIVVAWFSGADEKSQVKLAFATHQGNSFNEPITIKETGTVGRVDVVALNDGEAIVSWLDESAEMSEIKCCRVKANGICGPSTTVAESSSARASGFPKMARVGDQLLFAWTTVEETKAVETKWMQIADIQ